MRTLHTLLVLLFIMQLFSAASAQFTQTRTLKVSDTIPDVQMKTMEDSTIVLREAYKGKKLVLIFYRANWCPFCNQHLADLQSYFRPLMKLGYTLVAVSTESVANLKLTKENNFLKYPLLSDFSKAGISKFGIVNGSVAVPTVFITDDNHVIQYLYTNTDYKVRLSGEEIYEKAKSLLNER